MRSNTNQKNEKYLQKLEALHQHANDLIESTSIEMIAEYTIEVMYATLGMKSCDFYIREDQHLRLIKYRGWIPDNPNQEFPLDGPGILVKTANTKKTILISDVRAEPDYLVYRGTEVKGEAYQPLSEVCVPVIYDDEVVAILNTESNQLDFYDEQDQKLLETLANHVASAIQRIRLLEEQIQYEAKLEALHLHAAKLAETQNIGEIAEHTVDAMYTALGLERNFFMIVENENLSVISIKSEIVKEHHLEPEKYPMYTAPLTGDSVTARAATSKKSVLVQDVMKDPEWKNISARARARFGLSEDQIRRCEVAIPVIVSNKVSAVLHTESHIPNAYNEQDIELLETLASHVASAIQRIRLLEEQIQYETKLEALHIHANKLAEATSIEEISVYSKEALENTVRPDMLSWGDIGFVGDNVIIYNTTEYPLDGPGIIVRAVNTGETQIVSDTRKDVDFIGIDMHEITWSRISEKLRKDQLEFRELGEKPVLSEIEVPVMIDDTVVAVIGGESTELNAFTEHDQELLEILASHVASAIQRIRLLEDQIQYEAKLEERAKKLEALNIDLEKEILTRKEYEKEIIRVARESEVDRLRSQFLSTITHELRTPLTSIKGYTETIRAGWDGEVTPEMHETLNIILSNTDRLSTLTNDLLDVQRIATGRLEVDLEKIVLNDVIEQSVNEINPVFSEKNQVLKLEIPDEPLTILGDSQRLNQVLVNLLNNASKFSDEETTIHLRVESNDENILVSVKDSGIGIKETDIDRVFTPLAMIEKPVYVKGTGLGLSISKGIIDLHNGAIWAESEGEWKGTIFTVQLPKGVEP